MFYFWATLICVCVTVFLFIKAERIKDSGDKYVMYILMLCFLVIAMYLSDSAFFTLNKKNVFSAPKPTKYEYNKDYFYKY